MAATSSQKVSKVMDSCSEAWKKKDEKPGIGFRITEKIPPEVGLRKRGETWGGGGFQGGGGG